MPDNNSTPIEGLPYEEALAQLAEIVTQLENSQVTLDESIGLFDRGQALSKYCSLLLDKAELKVKVLTGAAEDITDSEAKDQ